MPTIKNSTEIPAHDDQMVEVVGVYAVQDLGRYRITSKLADGTELQSNKASYLTLEDDAVVNLGARPDSEHGLAGKHVAAMGRLKKAWPPPDDPRAAGPRPKPTLLEITSVEAR